jgi:hypothetical protein
MAEIAARQPFYENTWLAAGSILLLLAILGAMLVLLVIVVPQMTRWVVHWIRRMPKLLRWIATGAAFLVFLVALDYFFSTTAGVKPTPQDLLQQRLTQDERALDKGVLTYPALPTLKTNMPITLTVTVTDLGKHPGGWMPAQEYSIETGMIVYPGNVPTGGIVGLHLTCTTNVYCQALSSARQAIIGLDTSRMWSWDLTPLRPGPTSVVITATTYEETTDIVLDEEIIPIGLKVEESPWWAALDDWWHTTTNFVTTTAGMITTIGGAVAIIVGGARWLGRGKGQKSSGPARARSSTKNGGRPRTRGSARNRR